MQLHMTMEVELQRILELQVDWQMVMKAKVRIGEVEESRHVNDPRQVAPRPGSRQ